MTHNEAGDSTAAGDGPAEKYLPTQSRGPKNEPFSGRIAYRSADEHRALQVCSASRFAYAMAGPPNVLLSAFRLLYHL